MDLVDVTEAFEVLVEHRHLGFHAGGDDRGAPPHVAGSEHDHLGRADAGHAAHQDATAALVAFEEVGAHLRGKPSGDLAHRCEQRECAVVELHGLVGDTGCLGGEERLGDRGIGGEVQIGEERQILAEEPELLRLRFFHLDHHLRGPRVGGGRHDRGAGGDEVVVGDRRSLAGTGLDQDLDPGSAELADAVGRHCDAMLGVLDLAGDSHGRDGGRAVGHRVHLERAAADGGTESAVIGNIPP